MELKQSQGMQNIEQTANQEFGGGANKTMGETARKGLVIGAFYFTMVSLVYFVVMLLGDFGDRQESILVLTLIGAGAGAGLFQQVWFNYQPFILRFSYFKRYLGFNVCMFSVLVIMALIGGWLPGIPEAWVSFVGSYLVILLVMTILFNWRFKRENREYQMAFKKYQDARR
ncbi:MULTISPECIES: hypothetical protein [Atopobiaceae]|uniref:hypothetical protein n=1 Tax=Atopobiaceae TaxID=1643824 RepID=UPI00034E4420|nr:MULTISPECIES: hypothetical protein [Atopobiaceae]EPD77078.1 hypothetical protein HMPREF1527_01499 [Atopobium sp. oral taxon 199 str. F0494]